MVDNNIDKKFNCNTTSFSSGKNTSWIMIIVHMSM